MYEKKPAKKKKTLKIIWKSTIRGKGEEIPEINERSGVTGEEGGERIREDQISPIEHSKAPFYVIFRAESSCGESIKEENKTCKKRKKKTDCIKSILLARGTHVRACVRNRGDKVKFISAALIPRVLCLAVIGLWCTVRWEEGRETVAF